MSYSINNGVDAVTTGEAFTALTPKYPKPAGTMPGIVYVHAALGDSYEVLRPELSPTIRALLGEGYPLVSAFLGGTSTWANDTVIRRISDAVDYLHNVMGAKPGPVILIGTSAGGSASMVWASQNPTSTACVVGFMPVSDIDDIVKNNRSGLAASANAAYTGGWSQATYGAVHNPISVAAKGWLNNIKMLLHYGQNDTAVVPATVQALAGYAGPNTQIVPFPGDHLWTTYQNVDPASILAFVKANT